MSYGLFEHMAHSDSEQRVERRKALALARVRADKRFAKFLSNEGNTMDRESRLTLVAGDLDNTVRQACAEVGYGDWHSIRDAVVASLGFSIEAARGPKMCPYHREVTDISLAAGQPDAGFSAMAQHAWSANHCQGGDYEGEKCKFKPEMTTQTYWDKKAEKAQERKQQRELQQQQFEQPVESLPEELPEMSDIPQTDFADFHDSDMEQHEAPQAPQADLAPAMASRQADALKTIDVKVPAGPEPKMDKSRWTPKNVSWDTDAQMDGSPEPTRHQDIMDKVNYTADGAFEDDGRFEQTNAVLEKQDVTQKSDFSNSYGDAQLPSQTNPVTSKEDPDKNPLVKDDEEEETEDE